MYTLEKKEKNRQKLSLTFNKHIFFFNSGGCQDAHTKVSVT